MVGEKLKKEDIHKNQEHQMQKGSKEGHSWKKYLGEDATRGVLYDIYSRYIHEKPNGLLLVPAQTGHGKTFTVEQLCMNVLASKDYDNLFNDKNNHSILEGFKGIIYTTINVKNLEDPYRNLKEACEDATLDAQRCKEQSLPYPEWMDVVEERFQRDVLYIKSDFDMLRGKYDFIKNNKESILNFIERSNPKYVDYNKKIFKKLLEAIDIYKDIEKANTQKKTLEKFETEISSYSRYFRRSCRNILKNIIKKVEFDGSLCNYLNLNKKKMGLEWIDEIFPTIYITQKKIILISFARSILPIDDLFNATDSLIQGHEGGNKKIWFIDECHHTKEVIVDNILENLKFQGIDLEKIYIGIRQSFENKIYDESIYGEKYSKYLKELEACYKYIRDTYSDDKYSKTDETFKQRKNSCLVFTPYTLVTSMGYNEKKEGDENKKKKFYIIERSENKNLIKMSEEFPQEERNDLVKYMNCMQRSINLFTTLFSIIVQHEISASKSVEFLKDEIELKTRSLLDLTHDLDNEDKNRDTRVIKNIIINKCYGYKKKKKKKETDSTLNLYSRTGDIHIRLLKDSDYNERRTHLFQYTVNDYPENYLVELCENTLVFGLSATACVDTCLHNYDLQYVEESIEKSFYKLNNNEYDRLILELNTINRGCEKITNHISSFDSCYPNSVPKEIDEITCINTIEKQLWSEIYSGEKNSEWYEDIISEFLVTEDGEMRYKCFLRKRLYNVACAINHFLVNYIKAYMYYGNALPKCTNNFLSNNTSKYFTKDLIIDKIFKPLARLYGIKVKLHDDENAKNKEVSNNTDCVDFFIFRASSIKDSLDPEVLNELQAFKKARKEGKRSFIMTTYKLGEGINFQYPVDDTEIRKTVQIESRKLHTNKIDIDGMFFEVPRNIFPMFNDDKEDEDDELNDIKNIADIIIKTNYLISNCEASISTGNALILSRIENDLESFIDIRANILSNTESCKKSASIALIQALGRAFRSDNRYPDFYIDYESELPKKISPYAIDRNLGNNTYNEFIDKIFTDFYELDEAKDSQRLNKIEKGNAIANNAIKKMLQILRSSSASIKAWEDAREFILKYPVLDEFQIPNFKDFYCNCSENLSYQITDDDFFNAKIFFASDATRFNEYSRAMDGEILRKSVNNEEIRDFFREHGWAVTWGEGKYRLLPAAYAQLYLGALGEALGKFVFHKLGYPVSPIENAQCFELYDNQLCFPQPEPEPDTDTKAQHMLFIDFKFWSQPDRYGIEDNKLISKTRQIIDNYKDKTENISIMIMNTSVLEKKESFFFHIRKLDGIDYVFVPQILYNLDEHVQIDPENFHRVNAYLNQLKG
ncbi:MAG: hypothetical protein IKN64_12180 [Desulfovibrio sp.]|nr:hypothetical protein [Desulfovibrio sp.]